jgi:transposase
MEDITEGLRVVMFIREYKTRSKKTDEEYVNHKLVESIRTEKGPRQKVIMSLGQLTLPRSEWKKLAHALECQLSGQTTLLEENDKDIESIALKLISDKRLSQNLQLQKNSPGEPSQNLVTVDLNTIRTINTRSLGPELVCQKIWAMLGFDQILKKCHFSQREVSLARAVIFGRLITPGSERHTIEWFKKRTALAEMPGADISDSAKNPFYEIGDQLYGQKDKLEELLYIKEREYFPHGSDTIFLYDLTNTYMEGSSLGNSMAAYGHCKSKRSDCPLITLSLVVSADGMPVYSHIYKGNQSEPETMKDMLKRIETQLWGNQQLLTKPTIAMERGIATEDNVEYLRANKYPYVVIRREDERDDYKALFQSGRETFTRIKDQGHKSVYGDENNVYIKKLEPKEGESICKVLCISEGKARKEQAIANAKDRKRDKRFVEAINNFNRSIKKSTIKKTEKIEAKLARIRTSHRLASAHYETVIQKSESGAVTGIMLIEKEKLPAEDTLYGCYVLETTHVELTDTIIWNLYMTLSNVESAFRSMKEELGMRPVFHQTGRRSEAHLFISVLAYHILATVKNLLRQQGDHRQWETLRDELFTHTRSTVIIKDKAGNIYHTRVSGTPEDAHIDIYKKLLVSDPLKTITSLIKAD